MTDLTERLDAIQKRADAVTEWRKHFHPPQSNIDYSQRDVAFLLDLARKQGVALEAVKALHPRTCEINGDDTDCKEGQCPMLVCGPCGEDWPCPTIKALDPTP